MKQYFLKAAGISAMLALATGAFAQEEKTEYPRHSDDVIIIKPKGNADSKFTVEIKGDNVTINGKPLSEFKNDDISIIRRKDNLRLAEMDAMSAPRTRFRGGPNVYSYGGSDMLMTNSNKAFLGVGTEKTETGEGVIIVSITDESAAEKAGLKEGDVITKINDIKVNTPDQLTKAIGTFKPDEKVTVSYKRDNKEQKTTAVLTKRKNDLYALSTPEVEGFKSFNFDNNNNFNFSFGKPRLGLKAQETEDGKGLKVLDVDDESPAEKAGIKEGDIITSFDGTEVNNIEKLRDLSKTAIEKGNFKVQVTRDGKQQEINVKIPKNLKTTSL